jgi:release factor glutamine methyltransferase
MEIDQLVESFAFRFKASGVDNAKRVAEELLAHVFEFIKRLEPLATRIENGEPLQYVVGHVDFWGLELKCDPRALIPRPETELLVEEVLSSNIWNQPPATVVDVGTGTGCIVITLAQQRPDANFKAVDISPDALELARENARHHGLEKRIFWMENDLLERFAPESADAVVANLPYIASDDWKALATCVRDHEPQSALDSGPTGMELIAELSTQARYVLVPGGTLFLEFGFNQGKAVFQCLERLGYADIQIKHDLAGHDRIAIASNP